MANAIARRAFLATLFGAPIVGTSVPVMGTQFSVSGLFDHAGADNTLAYFSLGQSLSLSLDPQKLPTMVEQAEKLVGKQARIILEQA
jgi:hypothetical protein